MDTNTNNGLIYQLIPKVMAEIGAVAKTRTNAAQGYKFRGIDDIHDACHSALAKHGVFYTPTLVEQQRSERQSKQGATLFLVVAVFRFRFYGPDGSYVDAVTIGEALDSGDKASNKAMSAAEKYALIHTLCIATSEHDRDTEETTHEVAAQRPPASAYAPRSAATTHAARSPEATRAQNTPPDAAHLPPGVPLSGAVYPYPKSALYGLPIEDDRVLTHQLEEIQERLKISLADPKKDRFAVANTALLVAVNEEITRRTKDEPAISQDHDPFDEQRA